MNSPKKSIEIHEVVRLRQLLKKWRNFPSSSRTVRTGDAMSPNRSGIQKGISFLKRTISSLSSDSDDGNNSKKHNSSTSSAIPKGHLAVCVGEELERFIIPMNYLGHPMFGSLLQEAEESFGFQQTGVLRIPCDVSVFQSVLKIVEGGQEGGQEWQFGGERTVQAQCGRDVWMSPVRR